MSSVIHNPARTGREPQRPARGGWPQVRARLAAEKIAVRRKRAASPRIYMDGYAPGGRSENITPPSRG